MQHKQLISTKKNYNSYNKTTTNNSFMAQIFKNITAKQASSSNSSNSCGTIIIKQNMDINIDGNLEIKINCSNGNDGVGTLPECGSFHPPCGPNAGPPTSRDESGVRPICQCNGIAGYKTGCKTRAGFCLYCPNHTNICNDTRNGNCLRQMCDPG